MKLKNILNNGVIRMGTACIIGIGAGIGIGLGIPSPDPANLATVLAIVGAVALPATERFVTHLVTSNCAITPKNQIQATSSNEQEPLINQQLTVDLSTEIDAGQAAIEEGRNTPSPLGHGRSTKFQASPQFSMPTLAPSPIPH